jgi:hypothetical protein
MLFPGDRVIVHGKGLSTSLAKNLCDIARLVAIEFVGDFEFLKYVLDGLSLFGVGT